MAARGPGWREPADTVRLRTDYDRISERLSPMRRLEVRRHSFTKKGDDRGRGSDLSQPGVTAAHRLSFRGLGSPAGHRPPVHRVTMDGMPAPVSDDDYQRLLRFRTGLRRFERWSEEQAEAAGLTGAQHQLLLAVRAHPDRRGPTVSDLSEYLLLRHHSVVELIDRAVAAGLVRRTPDPSDRRLVRLRATRHGNAVLRHLTRAHLAELTRIAPGYERLWEGLEPTKHLAPERRIEA